MGNLSLFFNYIFPKVQRNPKEKYLVPEHKFSKV